MKGLIILTQKEITEQLRTYRLLIVGSVFLFFGIVSPVTLHYLPEILKLAPASEQIPIELPTFTAVESLIEYTGTIGQFGVLIAILVAMGSVSNELQRGTAVMTLSKPVTRAAFVTAKLIAMSLVFAISIAVASAVCFGYTVWLFGPADGGQYIILNLLLLLFLVFSLAVTLLFSSIFRSSLAAGGIAFAVLVGQAIFASIPWLGEFMPGQLLGWGNGLLEGKTDTYWWAFGITAVLTPLCVYLAQYVLKKRDI